MPELRLPLSGDVSQTINPWTWYFPFTGNQFGLLNVSLGNAGDPAVEQKILDDVGSYGKQLGRIGDVLKILVDKAEQAGTLSPDDMKAVRKFRAQLECVDLIKQDAL